MEFNNNKKKVEKKVYNGNGDGERVTLHICIEYALFNIDATR